MKKYLLIVGILICTNLMAGKVFIIVYTEGLTVTDPTIYSNAVGPKKANTWKPFSYKTAIWKFSSTTGRVAGISWVNGYKTATLNKRKKALLGTDAFESSAAHANGDYSVAFGTSMADGNYSFAGGEGSNAKGRWSFAYGQEARAMRDFSIAFGRSLSDAEFSFTGGELTTIYPGSLYSFAYGKEVEIGGNKEEGEFNHSFAFGETINVRGMYSFVAGLHNNSRSLNNTVFGRYNYSNGDGVSSEWNGNDYLFEIGNGNVETRSNAFTVLKNGTVGVNMGNPSTNYKLDVNGKANISDQVHARNNLFVYNSSAPPTITLKNDGGETFNPSNGGLIVGSAWGGAMRLGNHYTNRGYTNTYLQLGMVDNGYAFTPVLSIPSESKFVGIGTINPQYKMSVSGGQLAASHTGVWGSNVFDNADLVVGNDVETRDGFGGTNGSNIMLRSTGKSSITALDQGNDLGQISYQNLKWTIGENVGWGVQNVYMPGSVGIGTSSPNAKLDVWGNAHFSRDNSSECCSGGDYTISIAENTVSTSKKAGISFHNGGFDEGVIQLSRDAGFRSIKFVDHQGQNLGIDVSGFAKFDGKVRIGTTNFSGDYKLAVEGTIGAKKVKVTQSGWADYVFDPSYKLMSLTELEKFIIANKHLPEVPSTAEVEKNGVDLGDTQTLLLKKIEELTLYAINQEKKYDEQEKNIKQQTEKLKQLEEKLNKLLAEKK